MSIQYRDKNNQPITLQQALQLEEYLVLYFDNNNQLFKREMVNVGNYIELTVYNINNDSHTNLFNLFFDTKYSAILITDLIVYSGGYTLKKSVGYGSNMVVVGKINELLDPNEDLIGFEFYHDNNLIPDYHFTRKYYYDRNENPNDYLFDAGFDRDTGAFIGIHFPQLHIDPYEQSSIALGNTPQDIQELRNLTGMSQELAEYYNIECPPIF